MSDSLTIFSRNYSGVTGFKASDGNNNTLTFIRPQGTKSISANGTGIDVTEYAAVDVAVPAPSPSLQTKSKSYTPSETAQSETVSADVGYDGIDEIQISVGAISSSYVGSGVSRQAAQTIHPSASDQTIASGKYLEGAQTIKAVTLANLTADNIKSGVTVKVGDSADDDCVASVTGTYAGASKNVQVDNTNHRVSTTSYSDTGATLTVAEAGTYDIYWSAFRSSTSSGTNGTQLYKNDSALGNAYTSWENSYCQSIKVSGVQLAKDDVLKIYARSSSTSRYVCVENLTIVQTA